MALSADPPSEPASPHRETVGGGVGGPSDPLAERPHHGAAPGPSGPPERADRSRVPQAPGGDRGAEARAGSPGDRPPRWGLGDAALGWLLGMVVSTTTTGIWFAVSDTTDLTSVAALAANLIGLWTALVGVCLYASRRKGAGRLSVDFGLRFRPVDLALGSAGAVVSLIALPLIYLPITLVFGDLDLSGPARELLGRPQGLSSVVRGLLAAVGAPIVEELFYRGLVLRSLARRVPPWAAIVGSALLFGLAHLQAPQLPALVAFGLVLGFLAHRTGRLGPAIVAHMVFNGLTVISLLVLNG